MAPRAGGMTSVRAKVGASGAPDRAAETSPPLSGRAAGSLARHAMTTPANGSGTDAGSGGGGLWMCAIAVATGDPSSKGRSPVSISWATTPSA